MSRREPQELALIRWEKLHLLQELYPSFELLLHDVMELLGFETSDIQYDIGDYLANGPLELMVQAQRGQAKTTVAAAYAVYCLIHDPTERCVIVSAGGTQANEISTLIVRIILTMPELECLRPDDRAGDKTSVEHFDVHHSLKGIDKSPSVACFGIGANMQGKRSTLLIADDVESMKNSTTALQRAQLLQLTLDFASISTHRTIWLGTPQSTDSIYNTLPGRGVQIRIWPGRYPTPAQLENYGDHLAPLIRNRIQRDQRLQFGGGALKDQGQPVDPLPHLNEEKLQAKELNQGQSYFQLQHMLNTRLVDAMRFPLKPDRLIAMMCAKRMPLEIMRGLISATLRDFRVHGFGFKMQSPVSVSPESSEFSSIIAYVDPAGGGLNADETAYAVTGFLNGNVFLLDIGGLPGGYEDDKMRELAKRLTKWSPKVIKIEKNMGFGAFKAVFLPIWRQVAPELKDCGLEDDYVTGQKEARIIATLEPVINGGRLIVHDDVVEQDAKDCERYAPAKRIQYSLFHQIAKITKDRGALTHDDRVDALEGAVRHWQDALALDQKKRVEAQRRAEHKKAIDDPMGHKRYDEPKPRRGGLSRYLKR